MATYQITNTTSGHCLGEFEATDEQDALDAMSRDAGCRDHAHACEVTEDDGSDLLVVEVDWQDLLLGSALAGPYTMDFPGELKAAPQMVTDGLATLAGEVLTLTQDGLELAQELAR